MLHRKENYEHDKQCSRTHIYTRTEKTPSQPHLKHIATKVTPANAIRQRCLDCSEVKTEISVCPFDGNKDILCPLYRFRLGSATRVGRGGRLKAIRKYCLWCVNEQVIEVRLCPSEDCPLWIYRFGHRPKFQRREP